MPPVLAFQSVLDATVSARAVVEALFARLPANGSELVLVDINRAAKLAPVIGLAAEAEIGRIAPPPPRDYALTVVTNAGPGDYAAVARVEAAGATAAQVVAARPALSARHLFAVARLDAVPAHGRALRARHPTRRTTSASTSAGWPRAARPGR